jgi:hypothetical protein
VKDDGGPAFPANVKRGATYEGDDVSWHDGMTLRDYFAAKALAACIAEPVEGVGECVAFELSGSTARMFAKAAYQFADAMLAERNKQ